jgi:membrane protease YdiL (CAAX protease family)
MLILKQWFNTKSEIKLASLICFICLMLTCKEYLGSGEQLATFFLGIFSKGLQSEHFHRMLAWAAGCVIFYFLLPWIFSRFVFRQKNVETGLSINVPRQHIQIYLLMLLLVIPLVVVASFNSHFQATYPFYYFPKGDFPLQRFVIWEFFYLLQFIGVEYFFRGFILFNCKQFFNENAVYISVIPYCMIHFGKPMPETIAAIIAGIFLGKMALRSGSILPGIILHYSVAISMDLLSLWQQGYF